VHGKSVVYAKKVLILALSGHTLKSVRSSGKTFSVPNTPMLPYPWKIMHHSYEPWTDQKKRRA